MPLPVHVTTEVRGVRDSAESLRVELSQEAPTVRDLIEAKVRAEIAEWRAHGRRLFGREYATELDLRAQSAPAQVEALKNWKAPPIDDAREVAKAIRAFERDVYHVHFAGVRVRALTERVPGDRAITFVRQTPLPKL
jgi:hypothetical protein